MPIVLVRVDDRLIHGQILEVWVPAVRVQELFVPNDPLAEDEAQRSIVESAVPRSTPLVVDRVEKIAELLRKKGRHDVRSMVIVDHPRDALRLKRAGVPFNRLNLGNLRTDRGMVSLSRNVTVGERCLRVLHQILLEGVQVDIQSVPFEKPVDLVKVFRAIDPSGSRRFLPRNAGFA